MHIPTGECDAEYNVITGEDEMTAPTLLVVVLPEKQNQATGYDTWPLEKLLQHNQDAIVAGVAPRWIPIAHVTDPRESRQIVEMRLEALKR